MNISEIVVRDVDVIDVGESVRTAANRMHSRNVGCLVVVDADRHPVGMVTDRDLAVRVVGSERDPNWTVVSDVMSTPVTVIAENGSLETALTAMRDGPFRRLPVVNATGELVGMITLDDIINRLSADFGRIRGLLRKESPVRLAIRT